jgi:Probable transposase
MPTSRGSVRPFHTTALSGIGTIKVGGQARTSGQVTTCEIQRKSDRWYVSLASSCFPNREGGTEALGQDWGVETSSILAREDGGFDAIANPRFFKKHRESVERAQKHLEAKPKDSPQRRAAKIVLGRPKGREANQRHDFLHQTTTAVIARAWCCWRQKDSTSSVCSSPRTIEVPGKNVAQKAGLNREILATSPGTYHKCCDRKRKKLGRYILRRHSKPQALATVLELPEGRGKDAFGTDAPLQVRLRADARSERRAGQFAVGAEQPWPGTGPKRHPIPACGLGGVVHEHFPT